MAIIVKHTKVSTIPDGDDTSVVRPSDWNADHQLVGTVPVANGGTGAATLTGYVKGNGTSAMTAASTIPNTDVTGLGTMSTQNSNNISVTGGSISGTTVSGYIPTTEKAAALGVATLDAGGTVPLSQIPASIQGGVSYQGTWNASTNTPTLSNGVGTKGYYYVVSVAGSTNLDGITSWNVGDWAIFNGTVWQKVDNTDAVTSVNGYTGTVVLTNTDISGFGTMSTQNANSVAITGGTATLTSLTTPTVQATNSGGLSLKNSAGTTQISMGAGGGDNVSVNVSTNLNGANAQIDISPTGTGHVHMKPTGTGSIEIAPTNLGTIDNMTIGGTTPAVITGSTINANTKVVSPDYYAQSVLGGNLRTSGGTSLVNWDGGGSGNVTVNGGLLANSANKNVSLAPTGTGSVTVNPATAGTMNNMVIGGTTPLAITGTTVTATTFSGSGASLTSIPNSALVNSAITINGTSTSLGGSISVGTVTSVTGTSPVVSSGGATPAISMPAATTSVSGYLTSTDWNTFNNKGSGTVTAVSVTSANGFAGTSSGGATPALTLSTSISGVLKGNGTAISAATSGTDYSAGTSALGTGILKSTTTTGALTIAVAADFPTLNQNTTGTASNVTGTIAIANGGTGQTTANAAYNALSPMTTTGDIEYRNGSSVATRLPIGTTGQVLTVSGGLPTWATPSSNGGITWQSVQTANFTASTGNAYPINTTSSAITVTLPATPSAGNYLVLTDYAGTWATNNVTLNRNGSNIDGIAENGTLKTNRQSISLVYIDSTQGWIPFNGYLDSIISQPYSSSYLIVAGGAGGGSNAGGGGGAGGLLSGTMSLNIGTTYSVTVGAGGAGATTTFAGVGSNSSISSTISLGGGYGGGYNPTVNTAGGSGGSGGGGSAGIFSGGSGTSGQGNAGGASVTGSSPFPSAGGGGSGAAASNATSTVASAGGIGSTTSLITTTQATSASVGQVVSSSVYFSGGGGGSAYTGGTAASGGSGGGGAGGQGVAVSGTAGSANTGGGGGGGSAGSGLGAAGGSGCVLISVPASFYTGTTTGSPTVVTNGSNTVMIFKSSGSYTA